MNVLFLLFNAVSALIQIAFYLLGIVCMVKYLKSRPK